ncbi:MAG: hypothetical protein ABEI57_01740 [Halapricum sp.]
MSWSPEGLATSPSFRRYVDRLRETWPAPDADTLAASGGDEPTSRSHNIA